MDEADPTRWQQLFADLAAEFDAAAAAELEGEVRERARGEAARLTLVDRLRAAVGGSVELDVVGIGVLRGVLQAVGPDWLLLDDPREVLVPLAAVLSVAGLPAQSADPSTVGEVFARLGLCHALREIARRRSEIALVLVDGRVRHGTLDRVGQDFAELAEHPAGEPRRARAVRGVRTVPLAAIAAVRSAG